MAFSVPGFPKDYPPPMWAASCHALDYLCILWNLWMFVSFVNFVRHDIRELWQFQFLGFQKTLHLMRVASGQWPCFLWVLWILWGMKSRGYGIELKDDSNVDVVVCVLCVVVVVGEVYIHRRLWRLSYVVCLHNSVVSLAFLLLLLQAGYSAAIGSSAITPCATQNQFGSLLIYTSLFKQFCFLFHYSSSVLTFEYVTLIALDILPYSCWCLFKGFTGYI